MPLRAAEFEPPAFHPHRPGLVRPVPIDPHGLTGPTRGQTAAKSWRRTGPGLYLPTRYPADTLGQRLVELGGTLPAESALTGWAALHWLGARWCEGTRADGNNLPIPVVVPNHRLRERSALRISAEFLLPSEIRLVDGLPLTSPLRSACFEARHAATVTDAVRWLDLTLAADLTSLAELAAYLPRLNRWTGVPQVREAVLLADENCWSPTETTMRLCWVMALGATRIVANHPVFDLDGRFIATPDLLDLDHGVAAEYDGSLHLEGRQRAKDIRREGDLRRAGLEYVTMTAADLRDPADFLQRTLDARRRAARLGPRHWTIEPPAWWTPTTTVAARRALNAAERNQYLYLRRQAG